MTAQQNSLRYCLIVQLLSSVSNFCGDFCLSFVSVSYVLLLSAFLCFLLYFLAMRDSCHVLGGLTSSSNELSNDINSGGGPLIS